MALRAVGCSNTGSAWQGGVPPTVLHSLGSMLFIFPCFRLEIDAVHLSHQLLCSPWDRCCSSFPPTKKLCNLDRCCSYFPSVVFRGAHPLCRIVCRAVGPHGVMPVFESIQTYSLPSCHHVATFLSLFCYFSVSICYLSVTNLCQTWSSNSHASCRGLLLSLNLEVLP